MNLDKIIKDFKGLEATSEYLIVTSIMPPSESASGIIIPDTLRDKMRRDPDQNQRIVAMSKKVKDQHPAWKPGDYVRVRRDQFIPIIDIAGAKFDHPSIHQIICRIPEELVTRDDDDKQSKGGIILNHDNTMAGVKI